MIMRALVRTLINAVALAAAAHFVTGLHYSDIPSLLIMALIVGLVNAFIRPVVKILSCPLLILTLGLFTFVINAFMLLLAGWVAETFGVRFYVDGFIPAFWGALIVTIVSLLLSVFVPSKRREEKPS